ncbi:MAG: hypothetical protein CME71_03665 [Halobacteriovorax sp.]|nr:hypothetical protein [Halobacteriovorax sp.]|tara:strand:- start:383 stop:712 length:330 start_codon:yes stop_codon:yes gene_type:complete
MKSLGKPVKKTDKELYRLLSEKIASGDYVFKKHAKQRLEDREINDLEVLDILQGKSKRDRHRNKSKDKYESGNQDWNYCIEGQNLDKYRIRIIISFADDLMPIITVMWI